MSDNRTNTTPSEWNGLLDSDETIQWQGSPDSAFHIGIAELGAAVFGTVFAGFALFWMIGASQAGGGFWMFGLIHFTVGVAMVLGALFWGTWRRRHTFYTLTNKRAFIATDLPFKGRALASYPITADTPLKFDLGDLTTIHFAQEERQRKGRTIRQDVGFERIADGQSVVSLIRKVQQAQSAP